MNYSQINHFYKKEQFASYNRVEKNSTKLEFLSIFSVHGFFFGPSRSMYFNKLFFLLHILGIIYESSVTSNDLVMASKAIIALQTRETNLVVSTEYIFSSFIRNQ